MDLKSKLLIKVSDTSCVYFNRNLFIHLDKALTLEQKYELLDPKLMSQDYEYTTMVQWVYALFSRVNMETVSFARCGLPYPIHRLPLLRATWMVILDDNPMLVAFVVMNAIPNSIFSLISPFNTIGEIIVAHLGLIPIPILLSVSILLQNKIKF